MEHIQQLAFIEDIFLHLEKPDTPDGVTYLIDAKRYASAEQLEKEQKKIFQDLPIVVGAVGQLKNDGDYFLHDHTNLPMVVIKGKDGIVRVFINMCRHRGVRLLNEEKGHIKKNIVCPYHAWSYDREGCLKGILHPTGFKEVSHETHSLIPLDCHTRFGMIFVVPNPDLKDKFNWDHYLKEVSNVFKTFGLDTHVPHCSETRIVDANWKLLIGSALEAYHFKIAHSKTIGPYFLDNVGILCENRLHCSIIYPKKSIARIKDKPKSAWQLREHANILVNIFPNTLVLVQPDHAMVILNFPLSEKNTLIHSFMLIPRPPTSEEEMSHWDWNKNIFWEAVEEDNELAVLQQKTFNRFDERPMTIGSFEKLIGQFESLVEDVLNDKLKLTDF